MHAASEGEYKHGSSQAIGAGAGNSSGSTGWGLPIAEPPRAGLCSARGSTRARGTEDDVPPRVRPTKRQETTTLVMTGEAQTQDRPASSRLDQRGGRSDDGNQL